MAYVNLENIKEVKKVVQVPPAILQMRKLFEEIENTKREIILTENNDRMPFVIKTKRIETFRLGLFLLEHKALQIMQDEILRNYNEDRSYGDDHDE